ncbi:calcium-dependent protein kinase 14-like [Selaginella moellendorffii]|nr:calcium-dependent protein kinase 14-like [Selaginella moellendorffii]|eukprot:XP_024516140.1 calcium-dependent protein kinase 14-like [Selaginella moellendorffii]
MVFARKVDKELQGIVRADEHLYSVGADRWPWSLPEVDKEFDEHPYSVEDHKLLYKRVGELAAVLSLKRSMDKQSALVRSLEAMEFNKTSIKDLFSVEKELGRGGQAVVYQIKRKIDGHLFACKSTRITDYDLKEPIDIDLPHGDPEEAELEIRALTRLSKSKEKSGVVQLVDVFKDKDYYHFVMELCRGSLKDVLSDKKRLSEHEAAIVIKKVARTVGKIHDMGIAHRDIKTANILLGFEEKLFDAIKLTDFGLSWVSEGPQSFKMRGQVGTEVYNAPEMVANKEYDEMVDAWGVGIVLYEILSGEFILQGDWTNISVEAKDLILQLLHLDPRKRLPVHEVEKHPWVVKHSALQPELSSLVLGSKANLETKEMFLERSLKRRRGDQEEAEESPVAKKSMSLGIFVLCLMQLRWLLSWRHGRGHAMLALCFACVAHGACAVLTKLRQYLTVLAIRSLRVKIDWWSCIS